MSTGYSLVKRRRSHNKVIFLTAPVSCETLSRFDVESVENGDTLSDRGKPSERSMEDLTKSSSGSPSHGMTKAARALTVK